ncbi:MAG: cobalamin-dependent protein [bacterium]
MMTDFLLALEEAVASRDATLLDELFRRVEDRSVRSEEALQALARGVERVRARFRQNQSSIPELLLSIDVFRKGLRGVMARAPQGSSPDQGDGIVIGVVEGDTHDMGKNIVAAVLEAAGYRIYDLGRDVSRDSFLTALSEKGASLLALSTMMSTPLEKMREIIEWTRRLHPRVKILVGGAPLDEQVAKAIGADGYAESALTAPEEAARLLVRPVAAEKAVALPKAP